MTDRGIKQWEAEVLLKAVTYQFLNGAKYCQSVDCFLSKLSTAFYAIRDGAGSNMDELVNRFLNHPDVLKTLKNLAYQTNVVESMIRSDARFKILQEYLPAIIEAIIITSHGSHQSPPLQFVEKDPGMQEKYEKAESKKKFLGYLELLENQVSKIIVSEYINHGDLSERIVVLDLVKLSKNTQASLHEIIIGLARLVEKGYIHTNIEEPSIDVLEEVGYSLAIIDHAYLFNNLSEEEYKSMVDNIWRMVDPENRPILIDQNIPTSLSPKASIILCSRVYRLMMLLNESLCGRYEKISNVLKNEKNIDSLLVEALKIELTEMVNKIRAIVENIVSEEFLRNIEDMAANVGDENILRKMIDKIIGAKKELLESIGSMSKNLSTINDPNSFIQVLDQYISKKCVAGGEGGA